jgi:hypothetical protein
MKRIFTCEEYCNYDINLHDDKLLDHYKLKSYDEFSNLIIYGPSGIGKYTQALQILKHFSPSNLKYERKITFEFNKDSYNFLISDIHIEVDFEMLGCQSKLLWHEIFSKYVDILMSKQNKSGVILCKNFQSIHCELHDIFYSYINAYHGDKCNIKYIILTSNVSFIYNNILSNCFIFSSPKPCKTRYNKLTKMNLKDNKIDNLKNVILNVEDIDNRKKICDEIIDYMMYNEKFDILTFREYLYSMLTYNLDIYSCIWYINSKLSTSEKYMNNIDKITMKTISFLKLYNNNYRPIFHLENYFIYLISILS